MEYALVTEASRGIGRAIAVQLARDGYKVIINYKEDSSAAEQTLEIILSEGGCAELLPFDVSSPEAVDAAMVGWNSAHRGEHVDVLVNNAGIMMNGLFVEMDVCQWKEVIDTDLNSFFYVTRKVLADMIVSHHGRVINISSIAGQRAFCGQEDIGQFDQIHDRSRIWEVPTVPLSLRKFEI